MKQKFITYFALIFTFCVSVLAFVFAQVGTLNIINNPQFLTDSYSDIDEGGASVIQLKNSFSVNYTYQISNKLQFPYTGIYFEDTLEGKNIDLSKYNQITISISGTEAKRIPITLNTMWNLKNRPYEKLLQVEPEIKTLTLPLDDFKTPDWWLNTYNVIDDHTQFFKKVVTINFENCKQLQPGITDEIIITQLKLSTNNSNNYISLGVFWVVGLLVLLILYHFKKNKSLVPIKSIEYEPKNQTDSKTLIVNYIGNNYTNPVLSLQEIAANTNVKGSDISKILIEQFSLSFKEYLNYVRITETKKLLKNSELNISEIAYLVGYNNVTHFNRVFKSTENISPNEYRIK